LIKAICWLLAHPNEAKTLGRAATIFVSNRFSLEANTAQLIELIERRPVG
jgi:hypothetical protein